jgi:pantoate--beta-alanine ligase
MEIITVPEIMQQTALALRRQGRPIGLVPTMGCLHAGHLSLVKLAREVLPASAPAAKPAIVLSLFVNPTQFGPSEDFNRYPRTFENDRRLCEQAGVDILFAPAAADMYRDNPTVMVDETALSKALCGARRPGHFRGVLTVVAKLFNLALPDAAVFGQKDAQQLRLIRKMVHDLNFQIRIVPGPTVREPDGLAMSSRNIYLSPEERRDALCLVHALQSARALFRQGERDPEKIIAAMTRVIREVPQAVIDYIEIVDDANLQPVSRLDNAVLIALAVHIGKTRLIDNLMLPDDHLCQVP